MVSWMSEAAADLATINSFLLRKAAFEPGVFCFVISSGSPATSEGCTIPALPQPYLPLFCRVPGFSRAMLDEEMYVRKHLVRIRCMRNTMLMLPRDLIPAVLCYTEVSG